jgi:Fe-S-cluster-containing hydrogenase component 2
MHMKELQDAVSGDLQKSAPSAEIVDLLYKIVTRRDFLVTSGLGMTALCIMGCGASGGSGIAGSQTPRQVFVANAVGMVVADPTLCGSCRRCEAACVGYNQGNPQPSVSNVKVARNLQFGVAGVTVNGYQNGDGDFGNFRTVQDTCHQCPHPVPCQLACPHDAIEVNAPLNARIVNLTKCAGCGICVSACPWAMTSLTGKANAIGTHANKCHLCNGNPECVQACPNGALTFQTWADLTKTIPPRQTVSASIQLAADVAGSCTQCH